VKGVILCAGRGTRVQPFSFTTPKTLLPVANLPLLDHCIGKMTAAGIRKIGIVIHPSQHAIEEHVRTRYRDCPIRILYQHEPRGIAHAVGQAKNFVGSDRFVLLLGDNLICDPLDALVRAADHQAGAVLLSEVDTPQDFGIATLVDGRIVQVVEKPHQPESRLAVIGAYLFDSNVFRAIRSIRPSKRDEYEITDAIQWLLDEGTRIGYAVTEKPYFDVGTIERWLEANRYLLEAEGHHVTMGSEVQVENCILRPPVKIGAGCVLKNAVIGPHVSIADGCLLDGCTIQTSIVLEGTKLCTNARLADSVIGRGCEVVGESEKGESIHCFLGDRSSLTIGKM
jgi:glucose-1-phosphate thymidylyltransferase